MKLNTLYYPYASTHSLDTLKIALMYYEKISFLSPHFIYSGYEDDRDKVLRIFQELQRRGLLDLMKPQDIISMYHDILDSLIQEDLLNKTFAGLSRSPWKLYIEKVPSETINRYFLRSEGDRTVTVPFELGESIIINHVLFSCGTSNLCPLTDETVHLRALKKKVNTIFRTFGISENPTFSIRINLPSITGLALDETLHYIEQDLPTLESARKAVWKLVDKLTMESFSEESASKIGGMLQEIESSLQELEVELHHDTPRKTSKRPLVVRIPAIISVFVGSSWNALLRKVILAGSQELATRVASPKGGKYNNAVCFFVDPRNLLPDRSAISTPSRIIEAVARGEPRIVQPGSASMDTLLNSLNLREGSNQ